MCLLPYIILIWLFRVVHWYSIKVLHWNIRGLGLPEKRRFLKEFIITEHFDIICIQETKKEDFTQRFLYSLSPKFSDRQFILSVGAAGVSFLVLILIVVVYLIGKYVVLV
jgi:hypothetical protein